MSPAGLKESLTLHTCKVPPGNKKYRMQYVYTCLFYQVCNIYDMSMFGDQSANAEKS